MDGGGRNRSPIVTEVLRTRQLSRGMVRVVLGGPALSGFDPAQFSDAYVKLVFLRPGVEYDRPLDLAAVRARLPARDWPQQRTYTVRAWDPGTLEVTIDFVVHGAEGLAGPWALAAKPGDEMHLLGPGGGYAPDPSADWHLLAGDESALPAIAAALERLPGSATGHAFVEVPGPEHEQSLVTPAGVGLHWVHLSGAPGDALVAAVAAIPFPPGDVQAFVHGEAAGVKRLRRLLRQERSVPLARMSISGYWRLGADDEAWRAVKREWNADIERSESGLG